MSLYKYEFNTLMISHMDGNMYNPESSVRIIDAISLVDGIPDDFVKLQKRKYIKPVDKFSGSHDGTCLEMDPINEDDLVLAVQFAQAKNASIVDLTKKGIEEACAFLQKVPEPA